MDFKLKELDGLDDEILKALENEDDKNLTDEEEFDPLGVEKDDDEDEGANATYEAEEAEEVEDEDEEDDLYVGKPSTLILGQTIDVAPFSEQEEDNFAYTEAVTAYYVDNNYEQAIEKFSEAIKNEKKQRRGKQNATNEILAKSLYWQAEAYVKTHDIPKAIKAFESLVKTCNEHYLMIAAQRRAETLKAKHS